MSPHKTPPLILTLRLDPAASQFFNLLRQKYFPQEKNLIDAHLTLFHSLPNQESVLADIKEVSERQLPFSLLVKQPVSIGKGTAYKIESPQLLQIHNHLMNKWLSFLSRQDSQKLWQHVTIQNKVSLPEAQSLLLKLKEDFIPFTIHASGLQLWEYLDGPWKFLEEFIFK